MGQKNETIGFGFDYFESKHHFLVWIPKTDKSKVIIYERFDWYTDEDIENGKITSLSMFDPPEQKIDQRFDKLKVEISKAKWKEIETTLRAEFNQRLKEYGIKTGAWKQGQTAVQRLLGKEMVLLCWAIEDCDIKVIPTAIKNWKGLKPEERWWLYTMTNAGTGEANQKFGWRTAIRYALTENPVIDQFKQSSLFDQYVNDSLEQLANSHE